MKDLMIDIETLSTAGDALVLSIGVTPFVCNDAGIDTDDALLLVPDLTGQLLLGRRVDRSTQLWWAEQPATARAHWQIPSPAARDVVSALNDLAAFVKKYTPDRVWARGPHFDIAILDSLYLAAGIKAPWKYNSIRDVRTYCDDHPATRTYDGPHVTLPKHHPLTDNFDQIVDLWQHGMGVGVMVTPAPQDRDCERITITGATR